MANADNLIPMSARPIEEQKRITSAGGRASGEAKRRKKTLREVTRALLEAPLTNCDPETAAALEAAGLDKDHGGAMMLAALLKSENGDIEASRFVRDTSGQAPSQQVELGGIDGKPIEVVDLSGLTVDQLNALLAQHSEE